MRIIQHIYRYMCVHYLQFIYFSVHLESKNKENLKEKGKRHQQHLNDLEHEFKTEILEKETYYQEGLFQLEEEEARIEHLDKLVKEYAQM